MGENFRSRTAINQALTGRNRKRVCRICDYRVWTDTAKGEEQYVLKNINKMSLLLLLLLPPPPPPPLLLLHFI